MSAGIAENETSMLRRMIADGKAGKPVYITRVHECFAALPPGQSDRLVLAIDLLDTDGKKAWELRIPKLDRCPPQERAFIRDYVYAEVYNILSSIGARSMSVFADRASSSSLDLANSLNEAFCVDKPRGQRSGYGRAINVLDRMMAAIRPGDPPFRFSVDQLSRLPPIAPPPFAPPKGDSLSAFRRCAVGLEGKAFCGIDVGGTDIKAVLVDDGRVVDYKEYDWFPASFRPVPPTGRPDLPDRSASSGPVMASPRSHDGRAHRGWAAERVARPDRDSHGQGGERCRDGACPDRLRGRGARRGAPLRRDRTLLPRCRGQEQDRRRRGIQDTGYPHNADIDYESDFAELTDLDLRLKAWVRPDGRVRIINDGPMASFTAAVEIAASPEADEVAHGIFAHTLGTELGTGWVTETGAIPDIPLEVYNFIIDLGSWPERAYEPDDLRSVNNFNTGLPGTLQKYCSQSGVFRLALKYFPAERPDLFRELQDKGLVARHKVGASTGWYVPTEPIDQRKAFLEHMMTLPDREKDETNGKIWREIGESLAVTLLETKRILDPGSDERFLFGRMVKNRQLFRPAGGGRTEHQARHFPRRGRNRHGQHFPDEAARAASRVHRRPVRPGHRRRVFRQQPSRGGNMKEQNYLDNLVGVFGHPAAENPGVVIQEAAFRDLGLERWHFLTIDVDPE